MNPVDALLDQAQPKGEDRIKPGVKGSTEPIKGKLGSFQPYFPLGKDPPAVVQEAWGEDVLVQDAHDEQALASPAYDETVTTGYKRSGYGAIK